MESFGSVFSGYFNFLAHSYLLNLLDLVVFLDKRCSRVMREKDTFECVCFTLKFASLRLFLTESIFLTPLICYNLAMSCIFKRLIFMPNPPNFI